MISLRHVGAVLLVAGALAACGGAKDSVTAKTAAEATEAQIDADPIALLPAGALAVVNVDAHAFFTSGNFGSQVAQLAEKVVPIGDEAGFSASRDVDRVVAAAYSTQGADVAAVLQGRFDKDKIAQAAQNHTPTRSGGMLVASEYAGRTLYTVSNVGFTVLTPKTALVGTETGMRRTLDRIHDGHLQRDVAPWIVDTLETKGAEIAGAADLASQPIASASIGVLPLPWLQGLKMARVVGDFQPPGMHVAGTLTFAEPGQAGAAADGIKQVGSLANVVALTGLAPKIHDLQVSATGADTQFAFATDDASLRGFFGAIQAWVPQPR